jgi:CHAT domain-containing protein
VQLAGADSSDQPRGRIECTDLSRINWKRLPQTRRELREVRTLWPGELTELVDAQASEANLEQRVVGQRVLHIATHGFYLGSDCSSDGDSRGMGGYVSAEPKAPAPRSASIDKSPLLLAGLVLAGANRRDERRDAGDGILTAQEIALLDLWQLECAVLSACETGLGEVHAGEGMFGLRRAFRVAGARSVVLSLWPVQDRATREWMQKFYAARWQRGKNVAESVRHAALEQLAARRARGESTHPRSWGGFIAVGDWR